MSEDALAERLAAVERALADGEAPPDVGGCEADCADRLDALEDDVRELEAAVQAVRGYVGSVKAVNDRVEERADAAMAKVEALEGARVSGDMRTGPSLQEPESPPPQDRDGPPLQDRNGPQEDASPEAHPPGSTTPALHSHERCPHCGSPADADRQSRNGAAETTARRPGHRDVGDREGADGVLGHLLEGRERTTLGTAVRTLRSANRTLARSHDPELARRRDRLQRSVREALAFVRYRLAMAIVETTDLTRRQSAAVVRAGLSH